ncbi:MAG: hypothetical protein HGGPFJEG_02624 [Ignavibacteria bacterium]|nr:hypothetical protein [Ignavibacteria bacterium]
MKTILLLVISVIIFAGFMTAGNRLNGFSHLESETNFIVPTSLTFPSKTKSVPETISELKTKAKFTNIDLFKFKNKISGDDAFRSSAVSPIKLILQNKTRSLLLKQKPENITFRIPLSDKSVMELELTRTYPVSSDFELFGLSAEGKAPLNYTEGLHYQGLIKGDENSIASVSIFNEFVMGIISDENGNYNLGSIKDNSGNYTNEYVFFNDAEMSVINNYKCALDDNEEKFILPLQESVKDEMQSYGDNPAVLPVKIYFEADFQMYTDNQSNSQNVYNFITGFFNSVKTIYQNEGITISLYSVGVWTQADPYRTLNDSYLVLKKFGGFTKDNFQGNLSHLLSTRNAGMGGIAWIRVLCSTFNPNDSSGRYAFSNIDNNYVNYPTFSWTVQVVTHEMGHNLGSRHTHACNWPVNGIIQSIDSCYNAEGNCFTTLRPRVGTIMSYCHLWTTQQGGGINLASGFGQLPGDTIRLRYIQAPCLRGELNSSEAPYTFDLSQNFPNPFNPSTVIRFSVPHESIVSIKVFDVTGKTVAVLVNNRKYSQGYFDVTFNSAEFNLTSGIYFYKLETADFKEVKRMVLIK